MSRRIKILGAIYIVILAGIIVLADLRGTNYFVFVAEVPYGDKIGHFLLMGMLSLVLNLILSARTVRIWKLNYLRGNLIALAVVTVEEISQRFIGGRTFDLGDLAADAAGIVFFGEIARAVCSRQALRI